MRISIAQRGTVWATVVACMFLTVSARAQEGGEGQGGGRHGGQMMASPEERTERLTKALNLSDDQKGKVLSIYKDEQKQMEALRSDTSSSREDRRSKMMQIHENTVSQIKGVLNPDQAKKFDEMQQRMRERRERGGGNREGAPPPPQP